MRISKLSFPDFLAVCSGQHAKGRTPLYMMGAGRLQGGWLLCPLPLNQTLLLLADRNADFILGGTCRGWGDRVSHHPPILGCFLFAVNQPLTWLNGCLEIISYLKLDTYPTQSSKNCFMILGRWKESNSLYSFRSFERTSGINDKPLQQVGIQFSSLLSPPKGVKIAMTDPMCLKH